MGYRLAGDRGREILRGAKITYSSPQVDQNAHAVQELQTSSDDTKKSFPEKKECFESIQVGNETRKPPEQNELCTFGHLVHYSESDTEVWTLDIFKQDKFKIFEAYANEYVSNDLLHNFLVKFERFTENLIRSSTTCAFLFENSKRYETEYAKSNELTLLGRQFFQLLNIFIGDNIHYLAHQNIAWAKAELLQFEIFDLGLKVGTGLFVNENNFTNFWEGNQFLHSHAVQLNENLRVLKKMVIEHKRKHKKNDGYLKYLEPKVLKNLFDKKRLILRLRIKSTQLLDDRALCDVFSDFMKRLNGVHRVSGDIRYLRLIQEAGGAYGSCLDVLLFLEPNEKIVSIDGLIKVLREHWAKALAFHKGYAKAEINSNEVVTQDLLRNDAEANKQYLFVEETDDIKKKLVVEKVLPAFIGQAVFLQSDRVFEKTRQLVVVGFQEKTHRKTAKNAS
ncbi:MULTISPECIES: hypothetical protein [Acinetobacter]|uniref:hypothetical protein n=1 Tax=Acinetobacter TaxID=469 RepID=UPI000CF21DAF|nr:MULTISPECIES: hypothetical protein [Acinetobacter]PPZ95637.1 hypothetical protein C5B41_02980 [Acinetobacter ursingii]RZG69614.1 hypothetical protein EXE26_04900 [Acinetobacter junii]